MTVLTIAVTLADGRPAAFPRRVHFGEQGGTIGRGSASTLLLPDPDRLISRTHAVIVFEDRRFRIRDQSSASPLALNGIALGRGNSAPLAQGDRLRIGRYELRVERTEIDGVATPQQEGDSYGSFDIVPSDVVADLQGAVFSWADDAGNDGVDAIRTARVPCPAGAPSLDAPIPSLAAEPMLPFDIAMLSRAGGREHNEDAAGCWSSELASCCVLSDGAGGHEGGDVASKLAVRIALARFCAMPECSPEAIEAALHAANDAVLAGQQTGEGVAHMRATIVVLAIDASHAQACWGHLGDSRLYCFRDHRVLARTRDHSVVQRMIDAGYLEDSDLRHAVDRGRLYAALGETADMQPSLIRKPLALRESDVFLLCSDGFWEHIDDAAMLASLVASHSAADWLARMEEQVIASGARDDDNYSAIAVWCGERKRSASERQ